ncbi:MAG: hypothetical protein ACI9XO_002888 [Paraglaciecola sp.]|jgi:hypothetical protein
MTKPTEAASLAVFRIFFGLLIFCSMVRFWAYGWIEKLYIEPTFFFSYYGFEWVKPWGEWTYLLFGICSISAILVMIGWHYRMAILTLFFSFTYIELMDKTNYLNHYYFVSLLCFLLIFLPANAYFSVDAYKNIKKRFQYIPQWTTWSVKLMLCIVYFYAGLAKLNSDWLMEAMPLKIWLTAKYDIPLLGDLFQQKWMHYFFSWSGALYDLTIPFILLHPRTRWFGFFLVVIFHWLTWVLFPIGIFPIVMVFSAVIFLDGHVHQWILGLFAKVLRIKKEVFDNGKSLVFESKKQQLFASVLVVFFLLQLFLPFRHLLYKNELFWTEQGYRFSWRVMLMEKAGYTNFKIVDPETGKRFYVNNGNFLNPLQEKQMATQPDFILEYAHFLERYYQQWDIKNPEIYVESYVALNGRTSRPFIDSTVDLTKIEPSFAEKSWILPFGEEIWGF